MTSFSIFCLCLLLLTEFACCSVSDPHAVSWLSVVLSIGLGLHLEPNEYQMSIRWRLAKQSTVKVMRREAWGLPLPKLKDVNEATTAAACFCQY